MPCTLHVDKVDRRDWERYAGDFADYSIYQTWPYQQVRAEMDGQEASRVIIKDENGHVETMAHIRIKKVRPLGLKIGYVQWGPLARGKDGALRCSTEGLRKLKQAYLGTKVNIFRVVPNVCSDQAGQEFAKMLKASGFGFVPSVAPYHTMMFPVDIPEEKMRSKLHRSWRRGIKKAEQAGLEIRQGPDIEYFSILEQLYLAEVKRKGFKGLAPQVFVETQKSLSSQEKMNVVVAYYEGESIAAHATSYLGDTALGILAASNEKGLECWASYIVWWRTLLASKRAGMKRYDLGGIDPDKNPSVYQFKLRMGAEEAFHIGIFEASDSLRAKVSWRMAEKLYNRIKK